MNREEIKAEIARIVQVAVDDTFPSSLDAAEDILQFLEGIGFDSVTSALEAEGKTIEEIQDILDPPQHLSKQGRADWYAESTRWNPQPK